MFNLDDEDDCEINDVIEWLIVLRSISDNETINWDKNWFCNE